MDVQIITIGDELLIGQVIDTNSAWMGRQLEKEGFRVVRRSVIGDVEEEILEAVDRAMQQSRIVLITGGIGPTKDDITKKTLCRYFGGKLVFSQEVYENIQEIFRRFGRNINQLTKDQALVPDNCTVLQNKAGTAPGMWFEKEGNILVSMPGVPYEMEWLMTHEVLPRLKERFLQDLFIRHQTLWVSGEGEANLAARLAGFENELPPIVKLAYLPQYGVVRLRLSVYAHNAAEAEQTIREQKEKLSALLTGNIFAEEDKPIEELVANALLQRKLTMGAAESCTGGRIAALLTAMPGSSRYFAGGVVSYSNEVKHNLLGVSDESLKAHGAVSRQVVEQMASGALKALGCDCAVATSGIAGPGGGTPEKPVGTVWVAAAWGTKVVSELHHFSTIREMNMARASNMALLLLLKLLNDR